MCEAYPLYKGKAEVTYMTPVPKCGKPKNPNLTSITISVVHTIGTLKSNILLKVLLDSGSTRTLIHKRALPRGIMPRKLSQDKSIRTLAGTLTTTEVVH